MFACFFLGERLCLVHNSINLSHSIAAVTVCINVLVLIKQSSAGFYEFATGAPFLQNFRANYARSFYLTDSSLTIDCVPNGTVKPNKTKFRYILCNNYEQ